MPTPLPVSGAPAESQTWQELEDVFAAFGQLARAPVSPTEFYRTVLEQSVRALSAVGGAAWLCAHNMLQPVAKVGRTGHDCASTDALRRAHESLLMSSVTAGRVISISPHSVSEEQPDAPNTSEHLVIVGPVLLPAEETTENRAAAVAIIELWMPGDASPAAHRGCEQFLIALCELAADYHAFYELRTLRQEDQHRTELIELGPLVHKELGLSGTAYAVANEGRRIIGCDRLSVLVARGNSCRLLAASGVSRVERRSGAARRLAHVAELVRRTDEPAFYADGECDALPPVEEAITRHVEESHARHVAAIPVRRPAEAGADDALLLNKRRSCSERPQFVLVAEQFDAREGELRRDWLVEVAELSSTALYNALVVDSLPFGRALRPLAKAKEAISTHVTRAALSGAIAAAAIAALFIVPADFNIEAPGTMQPTVKRDVFAPRNGVVEEVLVKHGADVSAGQPLLRMRDPALELELKRVDGELETAQRQLDSVRSARTNRAIRDTSPVDSYRLSAEERELEQKTANSRRELELLTHEREKLVVVSPIKGRILTWDVGHELSARPVERGEVLVTVADLSSPWQLELAVPDDRMGYVLAAQKDLGPQLPVRFRLGSEERASHTGKIAEVCQTVDLPEEKTSRPVPTVLTKVSLDSPDLVASLGGEVRPGTTARALIECGRRSIGFVWFHDVWSAAVKWWKL
ncbi:MAG TPA: HlyD family efflux transporter periplasmic adaptor subunit [Lacipirellulaceae bacterium]|nr:HlyD family efflux transporter periplasmic adaptor subunit [Lacipirellulaceae bacterium]